MAALDIISNGLNIIINAQRKGKGSVIFPSNRLLDDILAVLKRKKYIVSYEKINIPKKNMNNVLLRYGGSGDAVIHEIKRISKSSRRVYSSAQEIPRIKNGYATVVVSTPKGVMTGREAREQNVGGEIVCHIY